MELLRPTNRVWRGIAGGLGGLALVVLAGCEILERAGFLEKPLAFSHRLHSEELDCFDCHEVTEASERPLLPSWTTCAECHEDTDEEKPPERRAAALFVENRLASPRHVTALPEDVHFPHKRHVAKSEDCAACHTGIETNERVDETLAVRMDDCRLCHAQEGMDTDCKTCHETIHKGWRPRSHETMWKKRHGQVVRSGSEATQDRCSLCHTESSCLGCHQEEKPENHNNFWRLRAHGIVASMDRETCAACHRTDFCERCHAETAPLSHTASWGSPMDRHCLTCHFPQKNEGCIACHKQAVGHLQAPPPDPSVEGHQFTNTCVTCHQQVKPIPHPFTGDGAYCRICHH